MELWKDSGMCKYLLAQDDGLMVNCATRGSCMSYIGSWPAWMYIGRFVFDTFIYRRSPVYAVYFAIWFSLILAHKKRKLLNMASQFQSTPKNWSTPRLGYIAPAPRSRSLSSFRSSWDLCPISNGSDFPQPRSEIETEIEFLWIYEQKRSHLNAPNPTLCWVLAFIDFIGELFIAHDFLFYPSLVTV